MSKSLDADFGPFRSLLWPVYRHELKKILPILAMLFLVCFNYTILHNMKDSVIITASGAEVIPFIKVWVMLPMAIMMTILFTKLSHRFSQENVFYIIISIFLVCYVLFAFFLYPLRDALHPHATADYLETVLPAGFKGLISMFRNWTFTGFYVICELWSPMVLTVLFWGFVNEVTRISEARRIYGVFGIASNISSIIAGQAAIFFSQNESYNPSIPFGSDSWEQTMMILVLLVTFSGICTMAIFRWINRKVLIEPTFHDLHRTTKPKNKKRKLTLRESFIYLSNSKYLICIAVLVVSYNLVINLVEVVWKDQLSFLYPSPSDYNNYINNLTSLMGVVSTITALFMAKLIERFGWTKIALVTPVTLLITSLGFFSAFFFRDSLMTASIMFVGTTPLAIAVFFGSAQNCLSRAAKYSFFDTTKEMAFIPLDHDDKLNGKAAIDGVGSRIGKSGGSIIHQGLLMIFATIGASAPYVAAILLGVIVVWIIATRSLGQQFNALAVAREGEDSEPQQEQATPIQIQTATS